MSAILVTLIAVDDPISSHPDIVQDGHGRGMSQKGASRWARGNLSYNINQDLGAWSVRWERAEQILVHYYTGIHLRDSAGNALTPAWRWNALSQDTPLTLFLGSSADVTFVVQNTGTKTWRGPRYPDNSQNPYPIALSYRIYEEGGACLANCDGSEREVLPGRTAVRAGKAYTFTITLRLPSSLPESDCYVVRWDMVRLYASTSLGKKLKPEE